MTAHVGKDVEKEDCKLGQPHWKSISRLLRKLEIDLPEDPAIPFWEIYPKDAPTCPRGMCSIMFIKALFALFMIARMLTKPKTGEWVQKMWYIYTMEYYYSAIKNEDIMSFPGKWIELENIILSENIQTLKNMHGMYSLTSGH